MKIMICHDGSERAQKAMERSLELFSCQRPEVIVVTVIEPPLDATSHDEVAFAEWKDSRSRVLKNASEYVSGKGFDVDAVLAEGDPRVMIMKLIEKKAPDVVVVAKRGGGRLTGMVLGSVSAYLVRHALCGVLVMH